jgi:hypothetical protein
MQVTNSVILYEMEIYDKVKVIEMLSGQGKRALPARPDKKSNDPTILRHTACLVFNPFTVGHYAFLF